MVLSNILNWFKTPEQIKFEQPRLKSARAASMVQYIRNHYQSPAKFRNDKRSYGQRLTFNSITPQVREIKYFNNYFIDNDLNAVASIDNGVLVIKIVG